MLSDLSRWWQSCWASPADQWMPACCWSSLGDVLERENPLETDAWGGFVLEMFSLYSVLDGETAQALTELLTVEANELTAVYEKHICSQQRDELRGNVLKGLSLN